MPEGVPELVAKLRRDGDARRKSLSLSGRERNVIVVLAVGAGVFIVCNLPQSVHSLVQTFCLEATADSLAFQVRMKAHLTKLRYAGSRQSRHCVIMTSNCKVVIKYSLT